MKKLLMVITMALASALVAQEKAMSAADARGKIGDIIADPGSMTAVMKQLSAADQASFLADVNAAIEKMPGSTEEKTAKFLDVNAAALKGAQKGNLTALVAEVYATVPPEALTVINERFAADMFNRAADPSRPYTDDQYKGIATNLLEKVQERTATADNAGVRNTFAILMLIRGSNGSPADLRDTLVADLKDPSTRDLAQNEWISPALGQGQEKTYDPMLGAAGAGSLPDPDMVLALSFVNAPAALAGDLASECSLADPSSSFTALLAPAFGNPILSDGAALSAGGGMSIIPRTMDAGSPYNPGNSRGQTGGSSIVIPVPEPHPYPGQTTGRH